MHPGEASHDIIVIGASAGGLGVLRLVLGGLPADMPASLFIVMHVGKASHLAEILDHAGPLPVQAARSGEPIERSRVYVAAPGAHLLLHDEHLLVRRGPRENLSRPAIDPLFRSAAATFGSRVVGVILSGGLNDGTAGLLAVKRCGGLAVIQDPDDALESSMPRSALKHVRIDHRVPAREMAALLMRLVREPAGRTPAIPIGVRLEAAMAAQEQTTIENEERLGSPSAFSCPDCGGVLWGIAEEGMLRYRCHTGHAFTAQTLLEAQANDAEHTLQVLLRSYREQAGLAKRIAAYERKLGHHARAAELTERAREQDRNAELVKRLLTGESEATPADTGD